MKIGIFDSGIGGLSVLHRARKMIPDAQFLYYADEKHVPYGEKSEEEIKGFVEEILNFLIAQGVDAIVIACNTATSVATKEFREQFPVPIVGMEPAVKKAVERFRDTDKRILVAATPVTIAGDKLQNLLERVDTAQEVDLLPLPMLVRFAEKGDFENPEIDEYLKKELGQFDLEQYAAVVLGCTHFNYFKEHFRRAFPEEIHFVDGNEGTLRQLIRVLGENDDSTDECCCQACECGATDDADLVGKKGSGEESVQKKVRYFFSGEAVNETEEAEIAACLEQLDKMYVIE